MGVRLRVSSAELNTDEVVLDGDHHHYLTRVLRVTVGTEIELFDGDGHSRTSLITKISAESVVLHAQTNVRATQRDWVRLISIVPLIKGDRMDWTISKLTELGVHAIAVVHTERTIVSIRGDRAKRRESRFERVAQAAARQSGRSDVPTIHPINTLQSTLVAIEAGTSLAQGSHGSEGLAQGSHGSEGQLRLAFTPNNPTHSLRSLAIPPRVDSVLLLSGPEGGLSSDEITLAQHAGFLICGLGSFILRAETAALAAITSISTLIGDLGAH